MERIVTSVKDHIKNLISWRPDERVQKALEGTCFYPFTQIQHDFKHSLPLIQALVNAYEPGDNIFTIGGHRIMFSLEDVLFITGLPVDAEPVTGVDGHHADVCREFLGIYEELRENNNSERDGMLKLSILRDKFAVLPDGNLENNDLMPYVRAYVLYIIGSVILPDKTGNYVPFMYLRLLRDIEDFNRYAWGAALLCHLHISLNNFFKTDSKCLAGSTFSLMIFAIERVPRLGLYLMGKEHPDGQELQDFLESHPNEFPLFQGWIDRLYPYSRKSHAPRDARSVANILENLQSGDICWRPYSRLDANFLPRHLNGQQHMGLAHTILLCFEKAVYHRPELCPGQFPAESVRRPHTRDLVIGSYRRGSRRGNYTDWSCHRKMRKYNDVWQELRKYIIASPPIPAASNTEEPNNTEEPENEQVGKELTPFDGSSEPPSIAVAPVAYLQQPITNLQQVQLRAQILVHGSLMQNSVPEQACMIAAFGQSDDGVCLWEPAWHACSESIHSRRQSHFSNMETPARSCLGNSTFSPAGSKGIPSPVVDPVMPLSPPLWSLSSPTDGLRSGGRLPFAPLQFYPPPGIGGIVEDSPSWLSQTPLWHLQTPVPRQWMASQQSSIDSPSCLLQTPLWHLQTPAPRQLVASPPTSSIGVSRPQADVAAAVGHASPERGHRASDTARTIYTVPESFCGTNSEAVASDNAQKPASGTTFKNEMVEGCLVEVFKGGGTCKAAWYLAEILNLKDEKAFVCYTELKTNEGSGKLKEWVPLYGDGSKAPTVRIAHPTTSMGSDGTRKRQRAALMDYTWSVGDRVDARMQDCERRQIKNMKSKREEEKIEDEKIEDENEGKRQKLLHPSTASLPQPSFDNALLPLATYNDDDDEEEEEEDQTCLDKIVDNPLQNEENGLEHQEGRENGIEHLEGEEEEDEDDEIGVAQGQRNRMIELRRDCPYLDTVNRQVLDFDFERFCSVSLSNLNLYACLVCGKYFQGRGQKSHAYTHSLEAGHHVYINMQTEKVYCLPDGYEINDRSLEEIRHVLNPRFSREQVDQLDKNRQWSRALDGSDYLPGMVGLNNIKETDFVNVTIQSLMCVTPLRNFFLIPENYAHSKFPLVQRFGELTRKIWHARNFKGQVSPHEFLQAVMKASKKRFKIGSQSDPVEFMSWLLNKLHEKLKSSKKKHSIIHECFQGELEVVKEVHRKATAEKKENEDVLNNGTGSDSAAGGKNVVTETSRMPFLMLGLDLPPPTLFQDVMEKNIILQVPLFNILKKFDGESVTEVVRPRIARMRYRVTKLPQYLILHMRRFTRNNFSVEKNPTLVNIPVKNLELKDYIPLPAPKGKEKVRSKYDLIANIVHDGKPGEGSYRVFVQWKSEELWYEMQDLHVSETLPQMVALSETYMQIYEQQGPH